MSMRGPRRLAEFGMVAEEWKYRCVLPDGVVTVKVLVGYGSPDRWQSSAREVAPVDMSALTPRGTSRSITIRPDEPQAMPML
jgi:hypothetical protein